MLLIDHGQDHFSRGDDYGRQRLSIAPGAGAQEMEPHAYPASPIGTNFLLTGYKYMTGNSSTNPALPITGIQASLHTGTVAYVHTFPGGALGQRGRLAALRPGRSQRTGRRPEPPNLPMGLGDIGLRLTQICSAGPRLRRLEFAQHEPTTTLGASSHHHSADRPVRPGAAHQHQFQSMGVQVRNRPVAPDGELVHGRRGRCLGVY